LPLPHPTHTLQILVRFSGLNRVKEGICSFWKVFRMKQFFPAKIEEVLNRAGAGVVQGALIDTSHFAIWPSYPEHAGDGRFYDLAELVFAFPQCFLGPLDLGQIEREDNALVAAFFEQRSAD